MHNCYRTFIAVVVGGVCAVTASNGGLSAELPDDRDWRLGDVFVGVGWVDYLPGEYWVFDAVGRPKRTNNAPQKVVDQWAEAQGLPVGVATGCMVGPDAALYTTSFHGLTVSRFDGTAPHARTFSNAVAYTSVNPDPVTGDAWPVFAVESIAFAADGSYFVAGQGPLPYSSDDELNQVLRPGFIFRYTADHTLDEVFEVPVGLRGVDQIEIGSDRHCIGRGADRTCYPTIYYTSEDTIIRILRPWLSAGDAHRTGQMQIRGLDDGAFHGSVYAIRALPPTPNDPERNPGMLPSGFLVSTSLTVFRLNAAGQIIRHYGAPGIPEHMYGLAVTPDGESLWTATYPNGNEMYPPSRKLAIDPETGLPVPNSRGFLIKFHIATGALLAKVQLDAGAVWGLCIKRAYTAGMNQCYETNPDGTPVYRNGQPVPKNCEAPPNDCGPNDSRKACQVPPTPVFKTIPDAVNYVGDVVDGHPDASGFPLATSPLNLAVTYSAINLPDGIAIDPGTGKMSGSIGADAYRGGDIPWPVTVIATDSAGFSAATSFAWLIKVASIENNPPVCTGARPTEPLLWPPGHALVPIGILGVTDPDGDPVTIAVTRVLQDEPVCANGSGTTDQFDAELRDNTVLVRAERTGVGGNGRVYEISFTASDGEGRSCTGTVTVGVPHDLRALRMPTGNPGRWNSLNGQPVITP